MAVMRVAPIASACFATSETGVLCMGAEPSAPNVATRDTIS